MNHLPRRTVIAVLLLSLGCLAPLCADSPPPSAAAPTAVSDGGPGHAPGMNVGEWKTRLGLSDDQASKLGAAFKAHFAAMKPLMEQRKQGMDKIREQLNAKAKDGEIQSTLDQLAQTEKSIQAEQENFRAGTAAFLTPTQRAKMLTGAVDRMRQGFMRQREGMGTGAANEKQTMPQPGPEAGEMGQ